MKKDRGRLLFELKKPPSMRYGCSAWLTIADIYILYIIFDLAMSNNKSGGLWQFNDNSAFIILFIISFGLLLYLIYRFLHPPYLIRIHERGILLDAGPPHRSDQFISFNKLKEINVVKNHGNKNIRFTSTNENEYYLWKPKKLNIEDLIEQLMVVMKNKGGTIYQSKIE